MDKKPTHKAPGGVSRRDFMKGIGSGAIGTAVLAPLRGQTIATKMGRVPVYEKIHKPLPFLFAASGWRIILLPEWTSCSE